MTAKSCGHKFVFLILLFSVLLCLGQGASASPKITLVEVWCGGDNGLTAKLRDTLENAFKSSLDFRLSAGEKPGKLTVTFPPNVKWNRVGNQIQVFNTSNFHLPTINN